MFLRSFNKSRQGFKDWLYDVNFRFFNKRSEDAETLGQYIERFIDEAIRGKRKNKSNKLLSVGTITNLKSFKREFDEYQAKRIKGT